jgi:hypothetical protein
MFVDQPSDIFGGTGTTGWMRIQRVGTSGGTESVRHAGFDMYLNGYGGNNFDFSWRFYYVTGGNFAQVIIGNNYPNNSVGYYVADSGNGRVRINVTTASAATVFTISNLINGYGLYDGTYLTAAPFITSTDSAWHSIMVTRTATPGKTMTHIGHPDVSVGLASRSFYGYMSEVILLAPVLTAQSSVVPDYNIFYKNAHVPFWQNGLIASYTPENWTGTSWVNGSFGTLPVTTLTGTTTRASSTNYQNIFTNLSSGAQTSARALFSFRRVNTLYLGPNFRIRRGSDNFVQAFYADGAGNLGTAIGATGQPLLDWLGGSVAYVDTWYDQSLNARHATQTTWTLQPFLNLARRAVDFTTNGTMFNLPTGTVPMNIPYTFIARHGYMSTSVSGGIIGAGGTNTTSQCNNLMVNVSVGYYNYWFGNDANANLGGPSVPESVVTCRYDGPTTAGTTYFFVNGIQTSSTARSGWNGIPGGEMIGKTTNDSTLNGLLYDCFIFASALSDPDRTSIENTILNSSSPLPSLYGPTSASITWPTGVLPSNYSMFHLAKYQKPSKGNYGRILQGATINWLSGFWTGGLSGVAYHGSWITQNSLSAHGTNWVLSTDENNLYRSLGRTRGTTTGGASDTLAINAGAFAAESADFTFQALMVYNRTLNATEYQMVEDYLANRFKIPVPPQEGLALSLDASDYFTTDGTTWTDRSPNGRNFTLSATGAYVSTGAFPYMALSANRATIATAVTSGTYNTLIVFSTIKNSTGNWRGLIARDGTFMQVIIESGTNRLGLYNSNGGFIPCDQNVDVSTLDQVYTRFNMHVWKLSTVSPYYQYYFNPNVAPCRPTGVITDSRASNTAGFAYLGDTDNVSGRYWGDIGTVLYYNRDLSDEELVETYQRHMYKYFLPTPFVPMSPTPNGYVFTRSGMYTPGTGVTALKVLVIAGGGGGGGGWEGGGGGAGGLLYSGFYYVTAGVPIQVIIGQGGRGTRRNSLPENGGNTIFGTLTAIGGGSGASEQNTGSIGPAPAAARSGGSGGGGSWGTPAGGIYPPGAGTTGQGNSGGSGYGAPYVGGGGGGAATPGWDASYAYAGNGGDGRSWTVMGVTKTYCGGGGGSLRGSGKTSGGLGGGGGGNGSGTGANATYYGSGGGAGGGNGVACMGGDGFQGIVLVEVNVDPYPAPVLQNPGNQNFITGGQFNINQTVAGIADITWVITQIYNAPNLTSPGNQTFSNGGFFTVTNTTDPYLTGALVWTISPTTGMVLVSSSSASATFQCSAYPGIASVSYVVTATGPSGIAGSSPSFLVTNTTTYLYNFSTFTFTPMGATGRSGPTAITYGTSTPGYGTGSALTLGSGTSTGMQLWTVPTTANYNFTVAGARGGNGTQTGGNGAIVSVTLTLTSGHVLRLLPGQIGTAATSGCNIIKAGGGGGSFVYNNTTSTLLIAAGGGGGGAGGPIVTPGLRDASLTTSGNKGDGTTGGAGGTGGNGGTGGSTACTAGGGGGGGWSGNGTNGAGGGNLGLSLINGATGGADGNEGSTNGGFGGAGASGAHAGGGGGGYSGGGGGGLQTCNCGDTQVGGGGGSYATVSFTSSAVTNTGNGYITISIANPAIPVLINPGTQSLNTASSPQTITVSQTSSTSATGTITWTYSTLPTGMTVSSSSGTGIIFSIAQNATIASQTFSVTATAANAISNPTSVSFTLVASAVLGPLAAMSGTAWTSAMGVFALYSAYSGTATILSVRRSSDNAVVDVTSDTFGNWTVSTGGTYSTWIGASTGYASKWWDQSGKGNHMSCSSTTLQPIVNFTNRYLDFKTSAIFDVSANPTSGPVPWDNTKNYTVAARHLSIQNTDGGLCGVSAAAPNYNSSNYTNNFRRNTNDYQNYWFFNDVNGGVYAVGNSVAWKWDGTNRRVYSNGSLITTQASSNWLETSSSGQRIGGCTNSSTLNGEMYYITMFNTALSDTDRLIVDALPYGVPALSTLTTSAWTSANAVYGVRALYTSLTTILTVRRASDNVTVNVIADTLGNYTVSTGGTYATWIGASTGYVTQWWDQSGKNAHATQATTASQPIFNNTSKYIDFKTTAWFSMPNGTVPYVNTNYTIVTKINTIANAQACLWGSGGYGTVRAVNALERGGGGSYAQYWWGDDCAGPAAATGNVVTSKYDNTVGRTIYVNGSAGGTNSSLLRNSTNVNNTIGCDWRNNAAGVFLNGELYYLQIYGSVFSDPDRAIAESVPIT